MATVIDLHNHSLEKNGFPVSLRTEVKALRKSHIKTIESLFSTQSRASRWCGYSMLHTLPTPLDHSYVTSLLGNQNSCAALFTRASDRIQFLLQEDTGIFCLHDQDANLLDHHHSLSSLLKNFQIALRK